jgi:23S rRNA (cytidine1920-2'-O)/16S rRNA (cytidine1409-2'-O)-methyltransferase
VARRRLDAELVRRGLASTRTEAQEAVRAGLVTVGGRPATKPATLVATSEPLRVRGDVRPYVSRGGTKLAAALERFGVDPTGRDCLDAGASTGGFTDRLLDAGASRVVAVDVGYGQLAWSLRTDPRVVVLERTNVRTLRAEDLPFRPSLVVADLSFVSLRVAAPSLVEVAAPDAELVVLVKPQFEVGAGAVGRGGVVRDADAWRASIDGVARALADAGAPADGVIASPIAGPAGNVEFLLHARVGGRGGPLDVDAALADGEALRR